MQNLVHHHDIPVEHPEVLPVEITPAPDEYGRRLLRAGSKTVKLLMEAQNDARTDALTETPNNRAFNEQFEIFMEQAEKEGDLSVAMVYFDIDGFKGINDTLGHDKGDEVLIAFANLLQHKLGLRSRSGEILARVGGDEFAALIHTKNVNNGNRNLDLTAEEVVAGLEDRLEGDVDKLVKKLDLPDHLPEVGISLGYVEYRSEGYEEETPEEFKKRADEAMYERKKKRKEAYIAQIESVEEMIIFNEENKDSENGLQTKKVDYFGYQWNVSDTNNLQSKLQALMSGNVTVIDAENLTSTLGELKKLAPKTYKRLSMLLKEKNNFETKMSTMDPEGENYSLDLNIVQEKYAKWRAKRMPEIQVLTTHAFNVLKPVMEKQDRDAKDLII